MTEKKSKFNAEALRERMDLMVDLNSELNELDEAFLEFTGFITEYKNTLKRFQDSTPHASIMKAAIAEQIGEVTELYNSYSERVDEVLAEAPAIDQELRNLCLTVEELRAEIESESEEIGRSVAELKNMVEQMAKKPNATNKRTRQI